MTLKTTVEQLSIWATKPTEYDRYLVHDAREAHRLQSEVRVTLKTTAEQLDALSLIWAEPQTIDEEWRPPLIHDAREAHRLQSELSTVRLSLAVSVEALKISYEIRDKLEGQLDAATTRIGELAHELGLAKGKLEASEMYGVVEGWKSRAETVEAQLDAVRRLCQSRIYSGSAAELAGRVREVMEGKS